MSLNPVISPYSTERNYNVGEYVSRDNVVYRFKKKHKAGEWDGTDVTPLLFSSDIKALRERDLYASCPTKKIESSPMAIIHDGAKNAPLESLVVDIEPKQDLQKNLCAPFKPETKYGLTLSQNEDGTFTLTGELTATVNRVFGASDPFSLPAGEYILTGGISDNYRVQLLDQIQQAAIRYSGASASSFTLSEPTVIVARVYVKYDENMPAPGGAIMAPMIRLSSDPDSTFVPYKSVRPISGWTECNLIRNGKNLLSKKQQSKTTAGITYTVNEDDTIIANGTATANSFLYIVAGDDDFINNVRYNKLAGNTLRLTGCPAGGSSTTYAIGAARIIDGATYKNDYGSGVNFTAKYLTNGTDSKYIRIVIYSGTTCNNLVFKPMLQLAECATDEYEPYQGENYTVNWEEEAGTVYGAKLDPLKGLLIVDTAETIIDDTASLGLSTGTGSGLPYAYTVISKEPIFGDRLAICNRLTDVAISSINKLIGFQAYQTPSGSSRIRFRPPETTDEWVLNDFKAWLTNNPLQIVYWLKEPIIYQLTPQQIRTLLGVNSISADCGNVELSYKVDKKIYIDGRFNEIRAMILERNAQ